MGDWWGVAERVTQSIHAQMMQRCLKEAELWAIIVATGKDGRSGIRIAKNASFASAATRQRELAGVDHWRLWVSTENDANAIRKCFRNYNGICDKRGLIQVVASAAQEAGVCCWTDRQIREQAEVVACKVESAFATRMTPGNAAQRKSELFLTLRALIPQVFFKPLFALWD